MSKATVLTKLEKNWLAFLQAWQDMPGDQLLEKNAAGRWSIRDLLTHITTWEDEALAAFPLILEGKRPPGYRARGGIDAFNAAEQDRKRAFALPRIKAELYSTHERLISYLDSIPEKEFSAGSRLLRRLKWDTYHHYAEHTAQILEWKKKLQERICAQ